MGEKFNPLGRWKPLKTHIEVNSPWLQVQKMTYRLPNGETVRDYYIVKKPPIAVVIPIKNNKTFLIKEYERGVEEVGYKFPSGRVDEGEDPETAAARELKEEVGIEAKRLVHLGESHIDPGLMATKADYFLCDDFEERPGEKVDDPKELFEGKWVELSEVKRGIATNKIKNAFVIVGFAFVSNFLENHKQ
jgi:ADP-ribose pyrophosphatase